MSDVLEQELRAAMHDRAARLDAGASARLRAVDYRPRTRRLPVRPAAGVLGLSGVAAATAGVIVALGSSAAPAFAGWTAQPTTPRPGQLAAAGRGCSGTGTPVLTDTRGPYTASIYADGATCVQGNGESISGSGGGQTAPPQGTIQLNGMGQSDSSGHALTMVEGRIGAGVTAVTVSRSDGSSVQATVGNGFYLAWWPGSVRAANAAVTTSTGTSTQAFPTAPDGSAAPPCPTGGQCSSGYGFNSGAAHGARTTSMSSGRSTATGASGAGVSRP